MDIISHQCRASPKDFGNSLKGLTEAYYMGATHIEADLSFTAEKDPTKKRVIIYHPGSTHPDLSKLTWQEINNSIFNVLNLETFLELTRAMGNIICLLDIKQYSTELVRTTIETVVQKQMQERVYITAFQKKCPWLEIESDGRLLIRAKEIYPEIKTHLLIMWPYNLVGTIKKYHPDAISFGWLQEPKHVQRISKPLFKLTALATDLKKQVAEVKKKGVKVWAGVLNNPDDMLYFINLGVDGIGTDDPKTLVELIKKHKLP